MRDVVLFLCLLLLASCDGRGGSMVPPSGGKLFETLLVGDSNDIVKDALQTDMPGLPQREPQFDVSSIDSAAFGSSLEGGAQHRHRENISGTIQHGAHPLCA